MVPLYNCSWNVNCFSRGRSGGWGGIETSVIFCLDYYGGIWGMSNVQRAELSLISLLGEEIELFSVNHQHTEFCSD